MAREIVKPSQSFHGEPRIPGDKSISHRGLIFGALAKGRSEVIDILESEDVQSTARCLGALGVSIAKRGNSTVIEGVGNQGFKSPAATLDCGNSGTTIRLLMGLLAGQNITATFSGDSSLVKRPMKRVTEPLAQMGAKYALTKDNFAPLTLSSSKLKGITYDLKVASAQIKSAIILAALSATGETRIRGEIASRDHTERLLGHYGATVECTADEIRVAGGQSLHSASLRVPGDPSTAAFWMAAAALIPNSRLTLENILLNPTRTGFLRVLQRMGATISVQETATTPEPVGTITMQTPAATELRGFRLAKAEIPSLIDEIPILAILATQARGESLVEGAEELRVKESDRIEAVATNLRAMGIEVDVREDGFLIRGPQKLKAATVQSFHDHRIAMAFSIAALVAEGESAIEGSECVSISYPDFYAHLRELTGHA